MKSKIYKALIALTCIISFIDWPVKIDAQKGQVVAKLAKGMAKSAERDEGLFKSCSHATQSTEEGVNRATQSMGEMKVSRPAATAAGINAATKAAARSSQNNYNYQQEPEYVEVYCPQCEGEGIVYDMEGYKYTCNVCNGAGTVLTTK